MSLSIRGRSPTLVCVVSLIYHPGKSLVSDFIHMEHLLIMSIGVIYPRNQFPSDSEGDCCNLKVSLALFSFVFFFFSIYLNDKEKSILTCWFIVQTPSTAGAELRHREEPGTPPRMSPTRVTGTREPESLAAVSRGCISRKQDGNWRWDMIPGIDLDAGISNGGLTQSDTTPTAD